VTKSDRGVAPEDGVPRTRERIFEQSAVIPYRWRRRRLRVLVISSARGHRWVLPKGLVEPHLTPAESAAKEALEEAGISGSPQEPSIGTYTYRKWGGTCVVEVFPMLVDDVFDAWDEDFREREWVSLQEAIARMREKQLRALLRVLPSVLDD